MSNQFSKHLDKDYTIRFIMDESFGSSNSSFTTSWVELQAFDQNDNNVAANKIVHSNFEPANDVTGQSGLSTIVNNKLSLSEWLSVNIANYKDLPVKIVVDLGEQFQLCKINIYHGWWTARYYKNIVKVSSDGITWIELFNYATDEMQLEYLNKPWQIDLLYDGL